MKIIILAAGIGSRLKHLTINRPKCLIEIGKKSLLDYQLDILNQENINPIIIVGGHCGEMLKRPNVILKINKSYKETNMLYSLFVAEEYLDEDVIVSYGDIVYSNEILKKIISADTDISVVIDCDWEKYWRARNENPLDDAETLKLDNLGYIKEIGLSPNSIEDVEGQYIGLMKFSKKGINILKKVVKDLKGNYVNPDLDFQKAYMTEILQAIIDLGYKVKSVPIFGDWIEVDTLADYENDITIKRLDNIIS